MTTDRGHMLAALGLARRSLGSVWPNPAVGCVIVKEGRVVGRGRTAPGGRPHAETEALEEAGPAASGATAFVTLEPCSHHGKTPPCAEALIAAGIGSVVAALIDPDSRVSGKGIEALRKAGIAVDLGLEEKAARHLNAGFISRVERGRPLVTIKIASSLDGRIATHSGESQWITSDLARKAGHLLRAEADAIMVGSGTAQVDDPLLTCRLPGLEERSPLRILVDSRLAVSLTSRLVVSAGELPLWILTLPGNPSERLQALTDCGADIIECPAGPSGKIDLGAALGILGDRGLTRLLVESGGHLAAALLRDQLVDRLAWFRAPVLLGGDGIPAALPFGVDRLSEAPRWIRLSHGPLGPDIVEHYERI